MSAKRVVPSVYVFSAPPWDDTQESVLLAALPYFTSVASTVKVDDGLAIKRLTDADVEHFREAKSIDRIMDANFAIQSKQGAGSQEAIRQEARTQFDRVILALRLIHSGPVEMGHCVAYQPKVARSEHDPWPISFIKSPRIPPNPVGFLGSPGRYELKTSQTAQLRKLYGGALLNLGGIASVALRRFEQAYVRSLAVDRLIDYWVALEALFSDGGGEISYKLAMRIPHFMMDHSSGRFFLYRCLKKAYEVRSEVVHGRGTKAKIRVAEELAREALRACLRRLTLEGNMPKSAEIDAIIAEGR